MVEFMESFNDSFEAANPHNSVDMSVVEAGELSIATQTRLTANDIDVIDIFGFSNAAQPYMSDVTPPNWQTLIEAGLLMDLTGQPFVDHYDAATIADAGSFDGRVLCHQPWGGCPTAVCSSTSTCSRPLVSMCLLLGVNWWQPARPSSRRAIRA